MEKALIIILNYNFAKDTIDVLGELERVKKDNVLLKVLVIDNGSKQREKISVLQKWKAINYEYQFISSSENLGFAGGNNLGFRMGIKEDFDYFMLLNNDVSVPNDFFIKLYKFIKKDKRIGLVSPKIYFAKGFEFHKERYKREDLGRVIWYAGGIVDLKNVYAFHRGVDEVDKGQYDKECVTDFASGACVLIRKEVLRKVGLFDENYFLYWEDVDLSLRAKKAGFLVYYYPKSYIWHKVSVSAGGSGSKSNDYFLTRNRLYFGLRHCPIRTKIALLRDSLRILVKGREWQKRGVLDFYLCKMGRGSWEA